MVKVGCCGFPKGYKAYMQEFKVVEVQISFYRSLSLKQIENWAKAAPFDFEFVFKAPQCVTHPPNSLTYRRSDLPKEDRVFCGFFKLTDVVKREFDKFISLVEKLRTRGIVFQTPSSFSYKPGNIDNMRMFFEYYGFLKDKYFIAWEPRGESWTYDRVKSVCEELGLIHATDPFLELPQAAGSITYYRMHGRMKTYDYCYCRDELIKLKDICKPEGYVFFNNSYMYVNAREFIEILGL